MKRQVSVSGILKKSGVSRSGYNAWKKRVPSDLYTATSEYVKEIKSLPVKRQVSVSGILKKSGVSRSGYNAWKKRVPSDSSVRRAVLKEKIQKIYAESHQNYGAPTIICVSYQCDGSVFKKNHFLGVE